MNLKSELMEAVKDIIKESGKCTIEKATKEILRLNSNGGVVSRALRYFSRVTLHGALPVFPALITLSCEAVGGKTEETASIGAALVFITGAADIHDDIIDRSTIKYSRRTVLGKFGNDVALLAGDALLIQGLMLLHRECRLLPESRGKSILSLIPEALFEISNAEAKEASLRKKFDTPPKEYLEVVKSKAVVPEIHCKIGAIIGNADAEVVKFLGQYGRTFGIVSAIRDDFIDLLEYDELRNRLANECPPLPILYALQNSEIKNKLMPLLEDSKLAGQKARKIAKLTLGVKEVHELKKEMLEMIQTANEALSILEHDKTRAKLKLLLTASIEGL